MENQEIKEKFLPIGTVVMLKGGTKRVMVTGFCSAENEKPEKVYDYNGCLFPEGYLKSNQTCLFDHSQIEKVYHLGLEDEEQKEFHKQLNEVEKTLNESKEQKDDADIKWN